MTQTKKSAKKFVVANWKMHGNLKQNQALLQSYVQTLSNLKHTKVVVCAPYPYLAQLQNMLANTDIAWGAQPSRVGNLFAHAFNIKFRPRGFATKVA